MIPPPYRGGNAKIDDISPLIRRVRGGNRVIFPPLIRRVRGGNFGCFPPYRGGNFVIPPPEAENFEDLGSCFKQKTRSKCTLERVFPVETPPTSPKKFPPAAGQERVFPVKILPHPPKISACGGPQPYKCKLTMMLKMRCLHGGKVGKVYSFTNNFLFVK